MHQLSLGISPCPNDTFIFSNWINGKIPTEIAVNVELKDVQELNECATEFTFDIIKVSAAHAFSLLSNYEILPCGGAMGIGVGPLLISKKRIENLKNKIVSIPGENTTAHALFNFCFQEKIQKRFVIFSDIEHLILKDEVDAGVIIHENRFTYAQKGLVLTRDLGAEWHLKTDLPLPLGVIMIKKNIAHNIKTEVIQNIQKSIKMAWDSYPKLDDYVRCHAQELSEEVMCKHINLYVNQYTFDMTKKGFDALETLWKFS